MSDLIREAPFGQVVRWVTKNKFLQYPEEKPDFQCPHSYNCNNGDEKHHLHQHQSHRSHRSAGAVQRDSGDASSTTDATPLSNPENVESSLHKLDTQSSNDSITAEVERTGTLGLQRTQTLPYTNERLAIEHELAVEKTKSRPIVPAVTSDGTILVDWYNTDDPANPQNWSPKKKFTVAFLIDLYTFVVYAGSAIYVSSEGLIMERFGVGNFKASLGLALYVLGYGLGPLILSPMSEIPAFGRNVPYVVTFAIYVILCVPTSLVDNLGGLIFLRFLLGFLGSPCLANGGASMGDMYSLLYLPYSVAFWVSAAFAAPALGPLLSGYAVVAENWRWSQWEVLWMSAPVFILFFFFLPETSPANILLRRAARLRKLTGNEKIRSQTEIDRKGTSFLRVLSEAIIKPIEICIKDPAVLFVNVYTALTYGIYYSFFEVFPLVYPPLYGFNIGETGTVFVCIVIGCVIAMSIYFSYLHFYLIPDIMKNGLRAQESRLVPALFACFGPPVGLFLFGWTARTSVHWIVSVIGITIYATSVYILLQCIFVYVPMSYPQYAASLFAGNDFCRSLFAFGAILFSRPMFVDLGIGKGVSLLGGLSVMGIIGMWLLYFYGAKLRARSKFAI
ncbi:MFS general substrate transporter [Mytilinidion resinicola]|uniref:MFS general substrate transporter n=1 Tax=Mytilinidion resinicola TaxID=574789 RepID=A0A6A6Y9F2_9PEZI|nr:MFS general substrate transporter [Mytilinidion resinicola]KAF2805188.1 MFS general substrate transporter [Mytilinidion resinicola]